MNQETRGMKSRYRRLRKMTTTVGGDTVAVMSFKAWARKYCKESLTWFLRKKGKTMADVAKSTPPPARQAQQRKAR